MERASIGPNPSGPVVGRCAVMRFHNGHVLGVAAFLAPLTGVVAPLGMPILISGAALAAVVVRRRDHAWPAPPPVLTLVLGIVVAWSALSLIWSIDPLDGLAKLPRFTILLAAGLVLVDAATGLSDDERLVFARLAAAGGAIGIALLLFELVADAPIRRLTSKDVADWDVMLDTYNRSVSVLVLLVWPAVLIVGRRNWAWGAAMWILALVAVWFYSSDAAKAALVIGAAAFGLARLSLRWAVRGLGTLVVLGILVSPLVPVMAPSPARISEQFPGLSYSGHHRLVIWNFTARRIGERPFLGWGFDSSRSIPGRGSEPEKGFTALPLHPHNAALQWWLELGAVGAVLGAVLVGRLFIAVGRAADSVAGAAGLGLVLTATTMCLLGFGIWQSWWMSALWLCGAFMAAAGRGFEASAGRRGS